MFALLMPPAKSPSSVLVTIDGVMWQDIYGNNSRLLVPHLYSDFIDNGIGVGYLTPMVATGPNHISLPGYLEITRGHPSVDCQTNNCNPYIDRSILEEFTHPAVFGSWSGVSKTLPSYRNLYYDIGFRYRNDIDTMYAASIYLTDESRLSGPDFLWVSLGDTDEYAHKNDRQKYIESLQRADNFIHYLVSNYPNATFIVTTDHGRNKNFRDHGYGKESERVWLMMRGPNVPHKGFVKTTHISLSDIYPTILNTNNSILTKIKDD